MKISRLLVLSALWLGLTGTATADVPEGVWTMPEPTGLEFTSTLPTERFQACLYNPTAKMFFASANDWNTRASVASFAYDVWFTAAEEADAPAGTYVFNNLVTNPNRPFDNPTTLFTDDGGSTWCDRASQGNWSWSVAIDGNGIVRIQNAALIADKPEFDGKFFGWNGTADTRLYMLDPAAEGAAVDWKFVTYDSYETFVASDDYEAYQAGVNTYFSGAALCAILKEAEELNINIAAWLAVYTNTSSTKEELDAAYEAAKAVVDAKKALQKLVDAGKAVNAPTDDAEALLANADATAEELKAATTALSPIVEARQALKKALDDAKEAGFTETAAYEAVYNDKNSTVAQLKKALEDLTAAMVIWGETHGSWDKPSDMTGKLTNPNFDNASYSGWQGTAPNMTGSGSHGPANVAEKWNDTFDTYQIVKGLPVGVYSLSAKTSWRGSWKDMENNVGPAAKLYATVDGLEMQVPFNYIWGCLNTTPMAGPTEFGTTAGENAETHKDADGNDVTYYSPNDPSAFRLYEEAGFYDTKVLFGVSSDTLQVRIGVKNPSKMGDADNWSCFDTFVLKYHGNGEEACQNYVTEAMKNFSEYVIEDGVVYTEAYLTAYQEAYSGEKTAKNMEEVNAIIGGINKAKANLDKNIELWKEFAALLNQAKEMAVNPTYTRVDPEIGELADYAEFDGADYLKDHELTNEELEKEIADMKNLIQVIIDKSKSLLEEGEDITRFIKNPGFDEDKDINSGDAEGWTIEKGTGSNITRGPLGQGNKDLMEGALGKMNYCFEAWHRYNWDVWQEITDLPKGIYELQVQGYVRCEMGGYTRGDDLVAPYTSPVYLYMNKAMAQFPSVYSESPADIGKEMVKVEDWYQEEVNGNPYPNSMGGAAQCFAWDMYKTKAFGLVAEDGGSFRIGVKMLGNSDWWCIWDSFKLTYHTPNNPTFIKPILEEALATIDLTKPMGKDVYEKAAAVDAEARTAIAENDGDKMFEALTKVYDLQSSIVESVALFEKLVAAAETLNEAIDGSENQDAINRANDLYTIISNGTEQHSITDDEAKAYIEEIDALYTKLKLPADWASASDDDPKDVTAVIKSASFSDVEETANSSEGWTNPGNLGNDDTQKSALAIEFWQSAFDMYQTIKGLPEGTYELTVDAWVRNGENEENFTGWKEDPSNSMALLYGVDGDSVVYTAPIANMMAAGDAMLESIGYDGEKEFTVNEVTYYVPSSLVSGKGLIETYEGVYTNKAIVKVKADEKLTIGIKKAQEKTGSWVVADDFKLFYLGKNSSKAGSPDLTGIATVEGKTAKVEYFTLDGRKATKAHKGIMIQKVTLSNGATLIQKIRN